MAKKDYESRTEAMLMPIVETKGFELVDVEWVKEGANWYLRAYIDKENGMTARKSAGRSVICWMKRTLFRKIIFWKSVHRVLIVL